ncbi:MAG: hypothetical protein AUG20_03715 [Gemmatimonas sp. 13_1_20CM_3_60_15]|nr:MAG: hypothetical protein AUG20_03715 [Gemmatimonas sp. 13_1_20CM_3_60_15]
MDKARAGIRTEPVRPRKRPRTELAGDGISPFIFSASGLTTQAALDELILDIPHSRGAAIERGILAGGIGTTLFYITIGRNGSVSDVAYMARTSKLSKTQLSLIFGGVNAIQALRIWKSPAYDHFFASPSDNGARFGLRF